MLVETTGQVFYELKAEHGEGGTSSQRGEIKQQGYLDLAENSFEVISHHLNWKIIAIILLQVDNLDINREYKLNVYVAGERGEYNINLGNVNILLVPLAVLLE